LVGTNSLEHSPSKIDSSSVNTFPEFFGTRKFITVYTTVRYLPLQ
jgi:hypothetical protein